MAAYAGPETKDEGLVFCLDATNTKSYSGVIPKNIITNSDLDTGWNKVYQSGMTYDEIAPPDGINSQVVGHLCGDDREFGYWYSYGNYSPQIPGKTYTVSIYVKTLNSNFTIEYYTADNSETGRIRGELISVPNDGNWHRVVWNSFVNPTNSQSDSLSFQFYYAEGTTIGDPNSKTWFCAPQMEIGTAATAFEPGQLQPTWNDIAGNQVSAASTSAPEYINYGKFKSIKFDGINDFMNADTLLPRLQSLTESTECYWFKVPSTNTKNVFVPCVFAIGQYIPIGNFSSGSVTESISILTNSIQAYYEQGNTYYFDNTWHCVHYVFGTNFNKLYLDGVELTLRYHVGTTEVGLGTAYTNATNVSVGNRSTDFYGGEGEVAMMQIFNRAFTSTEVVNHYNIHKKRFGL